MRDAVVHLEELELLTRCKVVALPAAVELLLSRTVPDLTMGRPAVAPASLVASHLHHCTQQAVALIVVLEFFKEGHLGHQFRHLIISIASEFLSQVSSQIRHRLCLAGAIPAIQSAIRDQILLLCHLNTPSHLGHSLSL